ncbi:MAG TPA: hypothetical protein VK497_03230 [Candidatus Saccharimonadales bacterium]|nr:hypothetical protein [Candidatus Saccharimonadales bacterium]
MFRKIVSNLAFSPALVGQLGFYAKRLRKEETTRRIGLIFTALALIVQSFAVFSPPESANASSNSDFIPGGVKSVTEYMTYYDRNYNNIKDIYTSLGITRTELATTTTSTVNSKDVYSWGMASRFSAAQGERTYQYQKGAGGTGTVYYRPLSLWDSKPYTKANGSTYTVFVGHSAKFGWFALMKDCGNFTAKRVPPAPPKPSAACQDITVQKLSTTSFRFNSKSIATNGATISGFTYTVKNGAGAVIYTKTVASGPTDYTQASPGTYSVSLAVNTSLGKKESTTCKESFTVAPPPAVPAAACTNLTAAISNRTIVQLAGESVTSGGATVSKYVFTVKDSSGKAVATRTVTSNQLKVSADSLTLSSAGKYSVSLEVTTSTGVKTSTQNCVTNFTIVPPAVCTFNPQLPANSPDCQPCPGDSSIWIKDKECEAKVVETKTAVNFTQGNVDATTVISKASDRVTYTINIENTGLTEATVPVEEKLDDVLEYATLVDNGGATFNSATKTLSWPAIKLAAGQKQSRVFVIELASTIPASPQGMSDKTSYDCIMTNTFGNTVDINVDCPTEKQVEQVITALPTTGPTENMLFAGGVLAVVAFFYARSRQMKKEVRLIRRDLNAGTI